MEPGRITIAEARADLYGGACPDDTRTKCYSMGKHFERPTPSGKVYTKCGRCKRSYILKGPARP